jgi:hypothetical protein
MHRRAGLSLSEVLIAIFVLALGLMGVLSLFPLGAVRMAQAIKDDRTAIHNLNIAANIRWVWTEDGFTATGQTKPLYPRDRSAPTLSGDSYMDAFCNAMEDPNYAWNPDLPGGAGAIPQAYQSALYPGPVTFTSPITVIRRGDRRPSYPVFIDPVGWNNGTYAGQTQFWIAGRTDCIPRRSLRRIEYFKDTTAGSPTFNSYVINPDTFYPGLKRMLRDRNFVLLEDIGFGRDGTPVDSTGNTTAGTTTLGSMINQIQCDGRYSCGLLFKRPQNNNRSQMDMAIVVYSGRPTDGPSEENAFTTRFVKGSTTATVYYDAVNGPRPKLRKNTWLLDGTMVWQQNGQYVPDNVLHTHGIFYRVIDVNENTTGELTVELQDPAESDSFYSDANLTPYGVGVVMDNVVEVFPAKSVSFFTRPSP